MSSPATQSNAEPLIEVRGLKKYFPVKKGILNRVVDTVKAVDGISFDVYANETVGLVGESGCGKTTAGRSLLRLLEPTDGDIYFRGDNIVDADTQKMRELRRHLQIIFQDPYSSLNPRMTVEDIVGEAIAFHGLARGDDAIRRRVQDLLERVGLQPSYVTRYPHEFSGGQRQRIGIARALALNPDFIVCDEAVSALDVSVQAQVVNLLLDLQDEFDLSYLFIAHDLSIVRHISDRIAVMYLGQIMELAECEVLFDNALHPYTQALLSAIPQPNPRRKIERIILEGDVPSPIDPPSGCRFHTRCPVSYGPCGDVAPRTVEVAPSHKVACHLYDEKYTPTDPAVWDRLPRLPQTDRAAELPPGVAEVIEEIAPTGRLDIEDGAEARAPEADAEEDDSEPMPESEAETEVVRDIDDSGDDASEGEGATEDDASEASEAATDDATEDGEATTEGDTFDGTDEEIDDSDADDSDADDSDADDSDADDSDADDSDADDSREALSAVGEEADSGDDASS